MDTIQYSVTVGVEETTKRRAFDTCISCVSVRWAVPWTETILELTYIDENKDNGNVKITIGRLYQVTTTIHPSEHVSERQLRVDWMTGAHLGNLSVTGA